MIGLHVRDECDPVRQGFNFYPLRSWTRGSRGFILALGRTHIEIRYSTLRKRTGQRPWVWNVWRG